MKKMKDSFHQKQFGEKENKKVKLEIFPSLFYGKIRLKVNRKKSKNYITSISKLLKTGRSWLIKRMDKMIELEAELRKYKEKYSSAMILAEKSIRELKKSGK